MWHTYLLNYRSSMARPFDPRLSRFTSATRQYLIAAVATSSVSAVFIVAQAWLLAYIVNAVFLEDSDFSAVWPQVAWLCGVVIARSILAFGSETLAFRAAAKAKSQLRMAALQHAVALGPSALAQYETGELSQLVTRGIDALDTYFARYLPQLFLACIIPVVVAGAALTQDPLTTLILVLTVPLIPVFMILVGWYTRREVDRQWQSLARLSGYFLDIIAGLPTLKVFRRAKAQAATLAEVSKEYRKDTLRVLRVSFLSAMVLELLASLSVAIVAVSIGVRLVEGNMIFQTALFLLILAPEAYLPLRLVGMHYHAATDAIKAMGVLLDLLDTPLPEYQDVSPDYRSAGYRLSDVSLAPGQQTVVEGVSLTIPSGRVSALVGPSGCGKSTIIRSLLGFLSPAAGEVELEWPTGRCAVTESAPGALLDHVGWLPQNPTIVAGTVRENLHLGNADPAMTNAEALERVSLLPPGGDAERLLNRMVGDGGVGLSLGEQRRLALARVLLRDPQIVLLDEPGASLDPASEAAVAQAIDWLREQGRTVVVVAHRPQLLEHADTVIDVSRFSMATFDETTVLPGLPS